MNEMIDKIRQNENGICVTIVYCGKIISFNDREQAQVRFKKSIAGVKKSLNTEYGTDLATRFERTLRNTFNNLDLGKARQTLVVYATESFGKAVWLPFQEKERIVIRDSFDLQPLYNAINRECDYWVLALSKSKTRLFRGKNEILSELINESFPAAYKEQFQYEKQRYALSHKAGNYTVRDTKIELERSRSFYRYLDNLLKPYLKKEPLPVILLGVKGNLAEFMRLSFFMDKVVAEIPGNYDHFSSGQIEQKVFPKVKQYILPNALLK